MKICLKCENEHEKSGTFCSRSCANSRVFSDEAKKKKSVTNTKYWKENREEKLRIAVKNAKVAREKNGINKEERDTNRHARNIKREWLTLGYDLMRWMVMCEQEFKCNHKDCGLSTWRDKPITLELEHKDGDRNNHKRDNLEALCPNCHSLTTTWRGRHPKGKIGLTDEDLYDAYMKAGNVNQTIKALGINSSRSSRTRILHAVEKFIE